MFWTIFYFFGGLVLIMIGSGSIYITAMDAEPSLSTLLGGVILIAMGAITANSALDKGSR